MKSMTASGATRSSIEQCGIEHFITEAQHHPVHGSHELGLARAPAHAFRDRQCIESRLNDGCQQRIRRSARFTAFEVEKLAFAFGDSTQRIDIDATGFSEAVAARVGWPVLSKAAETGGRGA